MFYSNVQTNTFIFLYNDMSFNCRRSSLNLLKGKWRFPTKWACESDVIILTSKTQLNPIHLSFRYATYRDVSFILYVLDVPILWLNNQYYDHLFKWIENTTFKEVENMLKMLKINKSEVYKVQELRENV